jgi:hypothetical protein
MLRVAAPALMPFTVEKREPTRQAQSAAAVTLRGELKLKEKKRQKELERRRAASPDAELPPLALQVDVLDEWVAKPRRPTPTRTPATRGAACGPPLKESPGRADVRTSGPRRSSTASALTQTS